MNCPFSACKILTGKIAKEICKFFGGQTKDTGWVNNINQSSYYYAKKEFQTEDYVETIFK